MTHKSCSDQRISELEVIWPPPNSSKVKIGCRHIQILQYCLGFFCCYGLRVVPSISLVAMTKSSSINPSIEVYDWSDSIQNLILSSFIWGFVISPIPGAELAQRFGARRFFCYAVGICGVLSILTPAAARYAGWQAVVVIRILTGAAQGVIPPCVHILISKWMPVDERGSAGSCVYAGCMLGVVIGLLSCGAMSESFVGWPSGFYVWGGISILWAIMFYFLGQQSPSTHPTISPDEKEYIESSLGVMDTAKTLRTPWTAILTSAPFWALLITHCADCWGAWMLLAKTPAYMANALGYNIFENGMMTAAPYFVACLVSFPVSFFFDKMVKDGRVSLKTMRKMGNSVGQFVPALALIGFTFINDENRSLAIILLIISIGFNVSICSGYLLNHVDLSPNYSGTLMGITNAAANIFGITAPLICGVIVPDVTNIYQWRKVFLLSAGIYIFGNIVYVLFGDATIQPWNDTKTHSKVDDEIPMSPSGTATPGKLNGHNKNSWKSVENN